MNLVLTRDAAQILDHRPRSADYPIGTWAVFSLPHRLCWAKVKRTSSGKHFWHEQDGHKAPAAVKAAVFLIK